MTKPLKQTIFDWLAYGGWYGLDASLKISLLEYRMLVRETFEDVQLIIVIKQNEKGAPRDYTIKTISKKDVDNFFDHNSWADKDGFLQCAGLNSIEDWLKMSYGNRLSDLFDYFGVDNVIGEIHPNEGIPLLHAAIIADDDWPDGAMKAVPEGFICRTCFTERGSYITVISKMSDNLYSGTIPVILETLSINGYSADEVVNGLKSVIKAIEKGPKKERE